MNNALTIPLSPSLDSFDLYQQQVQAIPLLTEQEEMNLAKKLHEENDLNAARQLIMSHLRLVIKIARSYSGYGLNQSDLVQEGNIGLMKAVKRFDPSRGVRLVSFAMYWIKAEIQEFVVRNWRLVKTATTKAQRKLFFNLRSMKKTLQPLKQEEIKEIELKLENLPSKKSNLAILDEKILSLLLTTKMKIMKMKYFVPYLICKMKMQTQLNN